MSSDDKTMNSQVKDKDSSKLGVESEDGRPGRQNQRTDNQQSKEGAPFDAWLEHKLHDMYDSVVKEPVPSELMDLIKKYSKS